jgi:curved DNA-binding protein CbpA
MNYYELMGLKPTAARTEISKRYMELVRENHPDRFPEGRRAEAEKKMQLINEAYAVLRDPAERARYDEGLAKPEQQRKPPAEEAKTWFGKGQSSEQMRDLQTAAECYKRAVALDATQGRYFFHLAKIESYNRNWLRQAIEHFKKAIELEPRNVEYLKTMARTLEANGMKLRAQKVAEAAIKLAPADTELKAMASAKPASGQGQPGGGVLGKIFGKS